MSTLDELTTPLAVSDVRTSILTVLATVGVDTTTWKKGSVLSTLITAVSIVIAALSTLTAQIAKLGFLSLSSGAWLALVAQYVFGVTKLTATFATTNVTLNNTGGGAYGPFNAFDVTFTNSATGKTYKNTAGFSVGSLQTGIVVPVQAIEAGTASNAAAGAIDTVPLLGVTCTNATAAIGTDDEADTDLQARALESLGARSPMGPWDAYAYVARSAGFDANGNPVLITASVPGTSFGITRINYAKDGVGGVDFYLATPSGTVTGDPGDPTTPLGAVQVLVNQYAEPVAVTARMHSAGAHTLNVAFEIWLYQNSATDAQIVAAAQATLAAYLPQRPIGGDVVLGVGAIWSSGLEAQIGTLKISGQPLPIFRVSVPQADLVLGANEVAVLGTVSAIAIHRVAKVQS